MAFTSITFADTAKYASGQPIPYAVVSAVPRVGFANAGTTAPAASGIAGADGTFSFTLDATADGSTAPLNTNSTQTPSYHVEIVDPESGEHVLDLDCTVPVTPTTTTIAGLKATAI